MLIENVSTSNFDVALRGMRNPMNSWAKSDSSFVANSRDYSIGPNDLDLCLRLIKAGPEHRKFLRQIFISMDISAARYWWAEFDTYKIGTVANSCSTMHKLTSKKFEISDFEIDYTEPHADKRGLLENLETIIQMLNSYRFRYNLDKEFHNVIIMKRLLPESYLQRRTVTFNYETACNIYNQRKTHRLPEWTEFCKVLENLPYMDKFLLNTQTKKL